MNKRGIESKGDTLYLNGKAVGGNSGSSEETVDYASVYGEVGDQNPSRCAIVREKFDSGIGKIMRFVHISDSHGGSAGDYFGMAPSFTDKCEADFLVHTGDIVTDSYNDDFSKSKNKLLSVSKPTFVTLGNHDVFKSPSLQDRFTKYISPLNEKNGLTGNSKTYYSVDYIDQGVKCIFLDYLDESAINTSATSMPSELVSGAMSEEQINWFIAELASAADSNLHVAIFVHQAPGNIGYPQPRWYSQQAEPAVNIGFLRDIVKAWQYKGVQGVDGTGVYGTGAYNVSHRNKDFNGAFAKRGHFIGWFCGHTHYDSCGWLADYPNQYCVNITRPTFGTGAPDGIVRPLGWYEYLFNYVKVDCDKRRVSIIRVGSDLLSNGGCREMFTYEYM